MRGPSERRGNLRTDLGLVNFHSLQPPASHRGSTNMTGSTKIGSQKTAHLAAYNRHFDWEGPLHYVRKAADASDRVLNTTGSPRA